MMIRSLLLNIPFNLKRNENLLKPLLLPLVVSKYNQRSIAIKTVQNWIDTLAEDTRKRVKLIQNEIALKQSELKKVPSLDSLNVDDYKELLEMSSNRRQRYYDYLFSVKTAQTNDEIKKEIRKRMLEEKQQSGVLINKSDHIEYGLGKNSMILKVQRRTIMSWRNSKLHRAIMLNATPLIFDCGFCDTMSRFEIRDTARQLKYAFSENRLSKRPFVMHICNMDTNSLIYHEFQSQMRNIDKLPIMIHNKDVTEIFPKDKIVYLSPDAEEEMKHFDLDNCYVVGGIVDKGNQMPLTLAKAKKLELRSARLPLNKYIRFHSHKTLTLDQMMNILLEVKLSQDWPKALKHVPGRKIFS